MKYLNKIAIALMAVTLFTACKYDAPEENAGYVAEGSENEWKATMSIEDLLDTLTVTGDDKYPPRSASYAGQNTNGENWGLFSVQDITDSIIIVGRVASSDVAGNIYKTLYIQDCEDPNFGIKISVDAGSLSGLFPIGQKIAINLKGFAIGKYAKNPQIGVPTYNNAKDSLDKEYKIGWEIGRIPLPLFREHVQYIGQPDPSKLVAVTMTMPEITAVAEGQSRAKTLEDTKAIAKMCNRLVKIENVHFTRYTYEYGAPLDLVTNSDPAEIYSVSNKYALLFAPTTEGFGYPQSRIITNDTDSMSIGTSEYAKFASAILPTEEYVGTIYGFTSYYDDNMGSSAKYADEEIDKGTWSIVLRSLDDVQLKNSAGEVWQADSVFYPAF